MGVSARISSCHLSSLSLSVSLSPTVTMLFLPRLPLLLFIAFLGFCCLTQVKADELPSCKSLLAKCGDTLPGPSEECKEDGKRGEGNECFEACAHNPPLYDDERSSIECVTPDGDYVDENNQIL